MAKRVFFSFHYQDVIDFRANVVRQHWMTKPDREAAGFFDASIWGNAELSGDVGIKRVVNSGLEGTTVTCVLIGSETYARKWVRYEILKSFKRGNSILAIHINSIKGRNQQIKVMGPNPMNYLGVTFSESGVTATLWEHANGNWKEYSEIDGRSSYQIDAVGPQYRGKGFKLTEWCKEYEWERTTAIRTSEPGSASFYVANSSNAHLIVKLFSSMKRYCAITHGVSGSCTLCPRLKQIARSVQPSHSWRRLARPAATRRCALPDEEIKGVGNLSSFSNSLCGP